jgi:lysylphosphatidylglycerol synthetase-like protein (DUF2156 family)
MFLLAYATFALGWFFLQHTDLVRRHWLPCPYQAPWERVLTADRVISRDGGSLFSGGRPWTSYTLLIGLLMWFLWHMAVIRLPSGEGAPWDRVMAFFFFCVISGVALALVRFLILWIDIKKLLDDILRVPMVAAFERIPDEIARLFGGYLFSRRPRFPHLAAAAWVLPLSRRMALSKKIEEEMPELSWIFGVKSAERPDAKKVSEEDPDQEEASRKWLVEQLDKEAKYFLNEKLPERWASQPIEAAFGVNHPGDKPSGESAPPAPAAAAAASPGGSGHHITCNIVLSGSDEKAAKDEEGKQAELFVASYVVMYLGRYFAQLRMLAWALAISAPIILFAAASYPFQPTRPRLDVLVALVIAAIIGTIYVLYQINCNRLISRITRTTPGRFTPDAGFFSSIMTYVMPVLGIVLAQVFGVFRYILEPLMGLFH